MAKTKAQIRDRVAMMLGKLARGQTATGDLADDIEDAYDQVYDSLERDSLVTWVSSSVPNEFVEPVAALVAFERAEGIDPARFQRIALKASTARRDIAKNINGTYNSPRDYEDF